MFYICWMVNLPQQPSPVTEAAIVRKYLNSLVEVPAQKKPRREPEAVRAELDQINAEAEENVLARLKLVQRRLDLERELSEATRGDDDNTNNDLEDLFVAVVESYSKRKGLSYPVWREVGVPAAVLKRAGVSR